MRTELQQFLSALIAALQTGRSIENAFAEAVKDLGNYAGTDTELTRELKSICAAVSVSEPLEKLVMELAYRSHLEELAYFGEVFSVGKKSGGNLVAVMRHTIRMLKERLEAEEEIYTVITQKRLEFYVMSVIPAAMIVYLRIGASGMMEQLYGNAVGALVMTVCLGIYGGCYLYGQRLLEIEN